MKIETKDGRVFSMLCEEPYLRKDGTLTSIRWWQSHCVKCGANFEVSTPGRATALEHSCSFGAIHCAAHKLSKAEATARWQASKAVGVCK